MSIIALIDSRQWRIQPIDATLLLNI